MPKSSSTGPKAPAVPWPPTMGMEPVQRPTSGSTPSRLASPTVRKFWLLNMNTIPAIIGAMLISPLMTPILGVGFALAILDTKLLKKSFKILFIQVAVSLLASTLYFLLSPISYASTEIITRTSPTIWDVVIAFVGGLAGIIGARKKEANNIVPGVAIATALMPPVCTVGYSIATGNLEYMVVASYLFSINCSFIMITHILALM